MENMSIKIEIGEQVIEIKEHGDHHIKIKLGNEEVLIEWKKRNQIANILKEAIELKNHY